MKVYVVTKYEPLCDEIFVAVKATAKEAEKVIREKFPNALRLGGTDNVDAGMRNDDWNRIVATGHLQGLTTIGCQQLG